MSRSVSVAHGLRKFFVFSAVLLLIVIVLIVHEENSVSTIFRGFAFQYETEQRGFYVNSSRCKMPRVATFTRGIRKIFEPPPEEDCSVGEAIVTSTYDERLGSYRLRYDEDLPEKLINSTDYIVRCCYRDIVRSHTIETWDDSYTNESCTEFEPDFVVPQTIDYGIIVNCFLVSSMADDYSEPQLLQEDAFMFVQKKPRRLAGGQLESRKRPSVLLLGIDSMSRMNLRRVMPKTYVYLRDTQWFEMQGYNKIEDNTFPNLMAILTGYNATSVDEQCDPSSELGLNRCHFVWNDFRSAGYYTAYGEDIHRLGTFNYKKKGFHAVPVDYYLRPFMIAVETNLTSSYRNGLSYCQGRRQTATYVYDFALDFARRYCRGGSAAFGLFWTNSFSHNAFEGASSMDENIRRYLQTMAEDGILDESVVILFSDHGTRWGPLMELPESYLEERLPMLFVWLPQWFRQQYPVETQALLENRNRLSSPFDLHATLKHLLALGKDRPRGASERLRPPHDCPICRTLLKPLPVDRGCPEAGIPEHWCTCIPYDQLNPGNWLMQKIGRLIVDHMNAYLVQKNISSICNDIQLERLLMAERREDTANDIDGVHGKVYRLKFQTTPNNAIFQATVRYWEDVHNLEVDVETISRLNMYLTDSYCLEDRIEKKYCFCRE